MMDERFIDRLLRIGLFVFLIGAGGLLMRNFFELRQQEQEIKELALKRTDQMLRVRLDALFHEWGEDLQEEAAAIPDSIDQSLILARWTALLRTNWAFVSVRLADERGNELAVYRTDSLSLLVRTTEGSKDGPPLTSRVMDGSIVDTLLTPWIGNEDYDPRKRIWFSKALENESDEPVWSLRQFGDTAENVLQVSLLIRGHDSHDPYRVIIFDVDLSRSDALDSKATADRGFGSMLFTSDGRALYTPASTPAGSLSNVIKAVQADWLRVQQKRVSTMIANGGSYGVSLEVYRLNGLALRSCVVLDTAPLAAWTARDRRLHWTVTAMLALLALLLGGLWWRSKQHTAAWRAQMKLNRNQSRRLEKAMGEREVLSREVHHRVKNNLQVVSSLLNLQASALDDGPVRDEFLRGKRRIDTIALVHHKLYGLTDLRNVDLNTFFIQLIDALAEMHRPQSRTVSVGVATAGIRCDQDTAIELGMILCELISNAYRHAFPYATGGHVEVIVTNVEGDLHRLVVRNNGVALPDGYAAGPGKLGLEIVDALAGQLDGSFHVRTDGGITFEVLFRMRREPSAAETAGVATEGPADTDPR